MVAAGDLYKVLGVPFDATPEDIRSRFRKLSHELHPDGRARRGQPEEAGGETIDNDRIFQHFYHSKLQTSNHKIAQTFCWIAFFLVVKN